MLASLVVGSIGLTKVPGASFGLAAPENVLRGLASPAGFGGAGDPKAFKIIYAVF